MKNNLENAFRNSLQDYEAPYDPKAWEAVSSKLGAQPAAVGGSLMSSALKWVLASVLLGAVVGGGIFLSGDQGTIITAEVKDTPTEERLTQDSANKNIMPNSENESGATSIVAPIEIEKSSEKATNANNNTTVTNPRNNNSTQSNAESTEVETRKSGEIVSGQTPNPPKGVEVVADRFVAGFISTSTVCEGESVVINNQDRKGKVKFQTNGEWIVLQPGKSYELKPASSTEINFVNDKGELIETAYIKIQNLPSANFTFEANIYEEGLPVTICQAYGDYAAYQWTFDDKIVRNGAEVKHHFYDKGDYEVHLKVIDANGCESTTIKTVRINDKYNLMAVDAFKPNGSDSRNRTFMPYSLTERDVKFQLTIVDAIDNSIVFTSNDVNNAWDGVDQKTGKMTPSNKAYIWKVQILNPLPNERPIYAGTIVHN